MTEILSKADIGNLGNYADRKNSYDDSAEISLVTKWFSQYYGLTVRAKPHGEKGVDIAVYKKDKFLFYADLERYNYVNWPEGFWKCHSFVLRKRRYLEDETYKGKDFQMIWVNKNLTKIIIASKHDIENAPFMNFSVKGKRDPNGRRAVPLEKGRMYGTNFTKYEKKMFKAIEL
jgi:hypothetical protein